MTSLFTPPVSPRTYETPPGHSGHESQVSIGNGLVHAAADDSNAQAFAANSSSHWSENRVSSFSEPESFIEPLRIYDFGLEADVRNDSNIRAFAARDFAHSPERDAAYFPSVLPNTKLNHQSSEKGVYNTANETLPAEKAVLPQARRTLSIDPANTLPPRSSGNRLLPDDRSTTLLTIRLQKAAVRSRGYHVKFIPEAQLKRLVTEEAIQNELSYPRQAITKLWKKPKTPIHAEKNVPYFKVFAILLLMKRPSKLRYFVESGVCDTHLPLDRVTYPKTSGELVDSFELRSRCDSNAPTVRLKRDDDMIEFEEKQWIVLAPIIEGANGTRVPHRKFYAETVLPYTNRTHAIKKGGFGEVFKAEIHPDHHSLTASVDQKQDDVYAVKALNSANEVDFNQEVTILRRLSNEKHSHKHLITLLATYEHKEVYHLIFPWADVDLFGYWARSKGRPKSDMLDDWLIEQCRGLVEGLHTIHRYETFSGTSLLASSELDERDYFQADRRSITTENIDGAQQAIRTLFGRHGDLKPQNILWFPDPSSRGGNGILKISDFGIARFSTKDVWETRKTGRVPNSPTYRSPEYDLNGKLTTACDVWALGCVYLQFVTWYLGGYRYLKEFGDQRLAIDPHWAKMETDTFFTIYHEAETKKAKVKHSVVMMIEKLRANRRCTAELGSLLNTIEHEMLVIQKKETTENETEILAHQASTSNSLNVLGRRRSTRGSCGDIFRCLGDIKPRHDREGGLKRRSTLQPTSPLIPSFFV